MTIFWFRLLKWPIIVSSSCPPVHILLRRYVQDVNSYSGLDLLCLFQILKFSSLYSMNVLFHSLNVSLKGAEVLLRPILELLDGEKLQD